VKTHFFNIHAWDGWNYSKLVEMDLSSKVFFEVIPAQEIRHLASAMLQWSLTTQCSSTISTTLNLGTNDG